MERKRGAFLGSPPEVAAADGTRQALWFLFGVKGRIRRLDFWLGQIGVTVADRVVALIGGFVTGGRPTPADAPVPLHAQVGLAIIAIAFVAGLWASLAITAKRWHDRDRAAAFAVVGFIPVVGWLWQFIECGCLDGTQGFNRFGSSPHGIGGVLGEDELAETFR